MNLTTNPKGIGRTARIVLLAVLLFVLLSAEFCLEGGCGTTTIVDMEDGELVGKIFCDGSSPNEDRTNYDEKCVGVTVQSGQRIECGEVVIQCPGDCS